MIASMMRVLLLVLALVFNYLSTTAVDNQYAHYLLLNLHVINPTYCIYNKYRALALLHIYSNYK